ncbi:MAG: methionine--tRNA ligase subunit beta, partial [Campylobacterales bacterium]|nr:methionine--tRNA ligase subunit beta [Campylobacterales bacterium]
CNKLIEVNAPWTLMKENKTNQVNALLGLISNILARVSILLHPVMPKTTQNIANCLGFEINCDSYDKFIINKELLSEFTIKKIPPLFPKIEAPKIETAPAQKIEEKVETPKELDNLITIDKFFEAVIKVGTVREANEVPKSSKLLLLKVDLGDGDIRQVVAGIREFYTPETLVNSQVCVVANLKPAKLMGYDSFGMLLAAKDKSGLCLIRPESKKTDGTVIK